MEPQPPPQLTLPSQPPQSPPSPARQSLQQLAQAMPPQPQSSPVSQTPQQPPPAYDNIYTEICTEIIRAQGKIIGADMSLEQAQGVEGLTVDPGTLHCTVVGDGSRVINDLIQKYRTFFGYAAVEVCREAASHLLSNLTPDQTPILLNAAHS
jgi:hypothetical protein